MAIRLSFDSFNNGYMETFGGLSWTKEVNEYIDSRTGKKKTDIVWKNETKGAAASLALEKTCFKVAKQMAKNISELEEILSVIRNIATKNSYWEYDYNEKTGQYTIKNNFRKVIKFIESHEAYAMIINDLTTRYNNRYSADDKMASAFFPID